ncbi:MAG TPA: N-acetylneuraminate synthase family protein [Acidimicrobiales bacterium]
MSWSGSRAYVIAEAGSNHDGDLAQAEKLVDVAADAGADAVKFQLFTAAGLYPANCGPVDLGAGPEDFFAVLEKASLPTAWLGPLRERAADHGIDFLCSAFDAPTTEVVATLGVPVFKIASPELTHLDLLRRTASQGRPVILSTGMASLGDVEEAVAVLVAAGAPDVALLQCTTAYPTPPEDANVAVVATLASAFGVRAGLSDHTLDPVAAPMLTVAVGGSVIEKHVTLSRALPGPDHPFAIEPNELSALVEAVREVEAVDPADRLAHTRDRLGDQVVDRLLGSPRKTVAPSEAEMARCDRRSLHALVDLVPGDTLGPDNVGVLRGERNLRPGLHPRYAAVIHGAPVRRPVAYGEGLEWADVLPVNG